MAELWDKKAKQPIHPSVFISVGGDLQSQERSHDMASQRRHALIIGDAALFAHRHPDRTRRRARHTIDTSTFFFFFLFPLTTQQRFLYLLCSLESSTTKEKKINVLKCS